MTIHLEKGASKQDIADAVKKANQPVGKGFDARKYFGKIKWEQEAVAYQRELRGNQ